MDPTLPTTSTLAASYEAGQIPTTNEDPMAATIQETVDKLNGLKNDVGDMGSRVSHQLQRQSILPLTACPLPLVPPFYAPQIAYLRDIRPRAMALLAQADAAEEEAARLEMERVNLDKEVERLKAIILRMEDMREATRQLTGQMMLDTALQMRHILENGKSIVPRVSNEEY